MTDPTDALAGFAESSFTHDGMTRTVFSAGTGPAVIVIHEMPGVTPAVAAFARRVVDAGFHVRMPSLFGEPGRPPSTAYVVQSLARGCVAKEFVALALDETSPAVGWLRALAADAHAACGGPGVGAVGMCFTGGFALGMMVDDRMLAPVLSQPSLPFPVSPRRRRSLGISNADLARVQERVGQGQCVMGLRFTKDPAVPPERFDTLRRVLGDGFIAVEIDSGKGNDHGIPRGAHSVLTEHFVDEPGHPTRAALDEVLAFFAAQLHG